MTRESAERYGFPVLAGVLPLALYVATACRDVFWMDTTELMLVAKTLGIAHPPGYPLLSLVARVAGLIPVLSFPFRLNLVAALAAAGSCVMVYFIVADVTRSLRLGHDPKSPADFGHVPSHLADSGDTTRIRPGIWDRVPRPESARISALFTALLWACGFELWQQATALEVYGFQALLVSVMILGMLKWHAGSDPRWLLVAFLGFGLALCNHTPVLLWLPSLLILYFASPARPRPATLGIGFGLVALCLLLYLYIPLRMRDMPDSDWGSSPDLAGLLQYLTARIYRYRFLAGGAQYVSGQVSGLPALFGKQFLAAWVLLAPGAISLWRTRRSLLVALLLAAGVVTAAALVYNIPDKEGYLLPAHLALVIVIGVGFTSLLATRFRTVVIAAGLLLILLLPALNYARQDRSRIHGLSDLSSAVLAGLPDKAVLFTDDYSIFQGIRWQQTGLGNRPDVLVASEHHLAFPWYLAQLARRMPVPEQAHSLAASLWNQPPRIASQDFGELAKSRTADIKAELVRAWLGSTRLFWMPRDFAEWPQEWRGYRLTLHGLIYEISEAQLRPEMDFNLPSPERYRTTLFRDAESQDLCLRFAATVCRRGILRFSMNDNAGAVADFSLSLEYFPDYPAALENKGIVFSFSGRSDSARFYLERFIQLNPNSPELPKVRQILGGLGR